MSSTKKEGDEWSFELAGEEASDGGDELEQLQVEMPSEEHRTQLKVEDSSKIIRKSRTALAREGGPTKKVAKKEKVPANLFLRGIAFIIDLSLFGLGASGAYLAGDALSGFVATAMKNLGFSVPAQIDLYTMILSALFVYFVLSVVCIIFFRATIGKLLMGLRLRGYHYLDLKFSSALAREFLFKPFAMALLIDFVMPFFNKDRRALHDYLAQTMVIKKRQIRKRR